MINKENTKLALFFGVVTAIIVILGQLLVGSIKNTTDVAYGAVGNLLAENYIPYVMSNGGYNSAMPIQTSSTFTASGAITFSGATTTEGTTGTPYYVSTGGIDYAYAQVSSTATSAVPFIIANPWFGTATSTLVSCLAQVTSNGLSSQALDVSTTTGTAGYGSSTPAIVSGYSTGAGQFTMPCGFNSATSTAGTLNTWGVKTGLLPGITNAGVSNYLIGVSEYLTGRISTSTAGTFSSYWTGTLSALFMKP